jgi:hypothetical protein
MRTADVPLDRKRLEEREAALRTALLAGGVNQVASGWRGEDQALGPVGDPADKCLRFSTVEQARLSPTAV